MVQGGVICTVPGDNIPRIGEHGIFHKYLILVIKYFKFKEPSNTL